MRPTERLRRVGPDRPEAMEQMGLNDKAKELANRLPEVGGIR